MLTIEEILSEMNSSELSDPASSNAKEYLDIISRRDLDIITLQRRVQYLVGRLNNVIGTCGELERQNDSLRKENAALRDTLDAERAKGKASNTFPVDTSDVESDSATPRLRNRKRAPRPVDRSVVDRIRNDRRYYAVACDMAVHYWQRLCDVGLVDTQLKPTPKCTVTVAARIVCCFQTVVDPDIKWAFFERHWQMKHLQTNLARSTYKDEAKYVLVNRVFDRPDNAPFLVKSSLAAL